VDTDQLPMGSHRRPMSTGPDEPVLPVQTEDDTDPAEDWRDTEERDRDGWLERERPPHWE